MTYWGLFRSGVCIVTFRQDAAPPASAISPPADLVEDTQGVPCEPGWTRQGVRQYTRVLPPEVANANGVDADLLAAIQQLKDFRALAKPRSAAQRDNFDDQIATLGIRICRKLLGKFDATD